MATAAQTMKQIEKELKATYKQAQQEAEKTFNDYIDKLAPKVAEKQKDLAAGRITRAEYDEWLNAKMFTAKHWKELSGILAQHQTYANITAMKIVNGELPTVYGHGYKTATENIVDQATGMGFEMVDAWTLHDRDTINRLITENPQLLPTRSVDIPKDLRWNEKHIQSALTQGLLHGDSIEHLADRLQTVTDMNHRAAVRNARTMVTGAENAGRQTSYDRMTKNGVKMKKVWMSTHDSRVRDAHDVMDGQEVDEDEKFTDGEGNRLEYPGDPSAPPGTVYNCRCTMHAKVVGFDFGKKEQEAEKPKQTGEGNMLTESQEVTQIWKTGTPDQRRTQLSEGYRHTALTMDNKRVKRNPLKQLDGPATVEQAISIVGGADQTGGSCVSAACAYIGNRAGYEVRDFRGGSSRTTMSNAGWNELTKLTGVIARKDDSANGFVRAENMLMRMEEGKEYLFTSGAHCAIVRMRGGVAQYLELQDNVENCGFFDIDRDILKNRFGTREAGKGTDIMIDTEQLMHNREFINLLEYINTPADKVKTGAGGGRK